MMQNEALEQLALAIQSEYENSKSLKKSFSSISLQSKSFEAKSRLEELLLDLSSATYQKQQFEVNVCRF